MTSKARCRSRVVLLSIFAAFAAAAHGQSSASSIREEAGAIVIENAYARLTVGKDGATQWTRTFNSAGANDDVPVAMAVDPFGRLVVAGNTTFPFLSSYPCITLLRLQPSDGASDFTTYYGLEDPGPELVKRLVLGAQGDIYVGAQADVDGDEFEVVRFAASGALVFDDHLDPVSDEAMYGGIDVDPCDVL